MRLLVGRLLKSRNIKVENYRNIARIADNRVIYDNGDGLYADCIVWATGAEPHDLDHNMAKCPRGWLLVNNCLQSVSHPNVFGGGDCITLQGHPSTPKAGVYAVRSAPHIAHNIISKVMEALGEDRGIPLQEYIP